MVRIFFNKLLLLFLIVFFSNAIFLCKAQCSFNSEFPRKNFNACSNLPVLNSTLYWNYNISSGMVEIAFRQPGIDIFSTWISWGINPTSIGMIDAQAFVAYTRKDGNLIAYTSPITNYRTSLKEGALSFPVFDVSAMYENNSITIFATLQLPRETITVDHVWQKGPMYGNNVPKIHSLLRDELRSYGTLNFLSGKVKQGGGGKLIKLKSFHGIVCGISWGIMLPVGVLIARYLKVFKATDPIWFKLHVTCQSSGYIIGLIGWATGLNLGAQLSGLRYKTHGCIGITLFCLATIQVIVGHFVKPKERKYRIIWNIFHFFVGYGTTTLGIVNVFIGIHILEPGQRWKGTYIGILVLLGCVAVLLETLSTFYLYYHEKNDSLDTMDGATPFNPL
ncbi:hypothetical protein ACB092_06G037300 [Castanea dentata]